MPNFGVTSLQELKRKLADVGQKLSDKKSAAAVYEYLEGEVASLSGPRASCST